jgi:hypothetical protein
VGLLLPAEPTSGVPSDVQAPTVPAVPLSTSAPNPSHAE